MCLINELFYIRLSDYILLYWKSFVLLTKEHTILFSSFNAALDLVTAFSALIK